MVQDIRFRLPRPHRCLAALAGALTLSGPVATLAQAPVRDPSIANLPRPGYEPRTLRLGSLILSPTVTAKATVNDNIAARNTDRRTDTIVTIRPDVQALYTTPRLELRGTSYAELYRYARTEREDVTEFGSALNATRTLGTRQSLAGRVAFDRTFERRSDPEADFARARRPSLINVFDGNLDYRYKGSRGSVLAGVGATKLDYLPIADSDRDLVTYRTLLRGTVAVTGRAGVFVQGYANRRETRLTIDRGGVDRRTTTLGVLTGISFDLGDRLQGEIGAGILRANPQDLALKSFTGFTASGRLLWRPRTRTAIVLDGFRGDVATVRIGAIGRLDTRISLTVDQEIRHNFLFSGSVELRNIHYRGAFDQDQHYLGGEVEGRYLINRGLWLVGGVGYLRRDTDTADTRFRQWRGTLGLRYSY